jgi:hypothetical protein
MRSRAGLLVPIFFVFFAPAARPAMAQSTISNVPTTDTVAKGKVYFEFDWLAQNPNSRGLDRLHIFTPKVVVGIGKNIEIGANVPVYHQQLTSNTFFQPNVKWRFASNERKGLAASAGSILVTPVNNQVFGDTYAVVYGNVSKQVKAGNYGPRFTAGPYGVVSAGPTWLGPKAGVILGYEQPIHSKIRIVADWSSGKNGLGDVPWYSGNNVLGYFTPGISFKFPASSMLNVGYSFGNDSYGNGRDDRFLFLRAGITF